MKKIIILFFLAITFAASSQTWTNPLTMSGEWYLYGIGDPYILKYRGTYYLYCSTKDNNTGVKCWSTKDFVTWSGAITCSSDAITKGAYAPEVVYSNGMFYMYTSPAGGGHYVLTSTSPTGPFTVATANIGKSIDGSVFINDDGKWYFYHADGSGILGCAMTNPTTIGADINLNARMGNNWTEGPCVFKRNGIYYLMYTGNHVISKGYRIDYAKNSVGPVNTFSPQTAQNPILIKSEGSFVGLGHGSAFIGPDLDSYIFCYHNLAGDYGVGPYRRLNFDRIAWNGDKLLMLGPTTWAQQGIQQADMVDFFSRTTIGSNWEMPNGGNWSIVNSDYLTQDISTEATETWHKALYTTPTGENYSAEFTLKEEHRDNTEARFGAVFGYTDEQNYGIAVLHSNTNQLEVNFLMNNVWETARFYTLPTGYNYNVWHNIRIEKSGAAYKFFVDGMQKAALTSNLAGGKVGYMSSWSHADFGYIAFSNKVNGSGIFDIYKPVPGSIEAVHYINGGEGTGYTDLTTGNTGGKYIRNDNVDIRDCSEGGFAITSNQTGEWYKYNVNVKSTGIYNLGLRYATTSATSQVRIWQGNTDLTGTITLPTTGGVNTWQTFTVKGLSLTSGFQTLKVETVTGDFDFYKMQIEEADNSVVTKTDEFTNSFSSDWNYTDGTWAVTGGQASISGYGKRALGNTSWSDYTVQTDIIYKDVINAGIIFRVNNPALGGAGTDPILGTDFYQGYFVTLSATGIVLGKQNYNWTQLATASGTYALNTKYTIKVVATGANIKIYVDDMNNPKINYTDTNPFINGKVGLRVFNSNVLFDNFSITTSYSNSQTKTENPTSSNQVELFPNPVSGQMTVRNVQDFSNLTIYKIDGQAIYKTQLATTDWTFDAGTFNNGLYLLKLSNNSGNFTTRKFIKN
ncbi:MAG: family 43 glycosylhydrolase [Paludibacter sp.]|nr:family 43 glycosylhydrolase [Paludibacter sp.]